MTAVDFAILIAALLSNFVVSHAFDIAKIFLVIALVVMTLNLVLAVRSNLEYAQLVRRIG